MSPVSQKLKLRAEQGQQLCPLLNMKLNNNKYSSIPGASSKMKIGFTKFWEGYQISQRFQNFHLSMLLSVVRDQWKYFILKLFNNSFSTRNSQTFLFVQSGPCAQVQIFHSIKGFPQWKRKVTKVLSFVSFAPVFNQLFCHELTELFDSIIFCALHHHIFILLLFQFSCGTM